MRGDDGSIGQSRQLVIVLGDITLYTIDGSMMERRQKIAMEAPFCHTPVEIV